MESSGTAWTGEGRTDGVGPGVVDSSTLAGDSPNVETNTWLHTSARSDKLSPEPGDTMGVEVEGCESVLLGLWMRV